MKCAIQIACTEAEPASLPTAARIKKTLDCISQEFHLSGLQVTLRIVDQAESRALNQQYRGKDKPTNVLSFAHLADNFITPAATKTKLQQELGDLVLCHAVIAAEALAQGKHIQDHYAHLIIHGLLHLLGFDHETEAEALEMEQIEIDLLKQLNINNPYEELRHEA